MRLPKLRTVLLLYTIVFAGRIFAQEPVVNEQAAELPHPGRLSPGWWSYFEVKEGLAERISKFSETLNSSTNELDEPKRGLLNQQIQQVISLLQRYQTIKGQSAEVRVDVIKSIEDPTLSVAIEDFLTIRRLEKVKDSLQKELDWQASLLKGMAAQQSRNRLAYLDLKPSDPKRFGAGVELIRARIELELRTLDLQRQKSELEIQEEQYGQLSRDFESALSELNPSPDGLEDWKKKIKNTGETLADWRPDTTITDQIEVDFPEASTTALSRGALLEETHQRLQGALLRMEAIQPQLAYSYERLLSEGGASSTTSDHQLLTESEELATAIQLEAEQAQETLERARLGASSQLEGVEENSTTGQFLLRTIARANEGEVLRNDVEEAIELTRFLNSLLGRELLGEEGWWGQVRARSESEGTRWWKRTLEFLRAPLFEVNEAPVTSIGIFRLLLILISAFWISRGVRSALRRFSSKWDKGKERSLFMIERIAHYVVLAIGILIGLSSLGIDLTKVALFASALGIGLGFGLQTIVSNFVAGLIMLFEKSMNVGDFIELQSGITGEVREINMRSTLITTNDNVDVLVPNSEFVGGTVTNWTLREALRRTRIPFGVAYGTDKDLVRRAVLEAADRVPWTFTSTTGRAPQVWFVNFGESSLDFELVVWLKPEAVKRPGAVSADYLWEIETSLRQYDIEVPFPQRDLHIRTGSLSMREELKGDSKIED